MAHVENTIQNRKYKHLSHFKRGKISDLHKAGHSNREIARRLGCVHPTIANKLKCETVKQLKTGRETYTGYFPETGQNEGDKLPSKRKLAQQLNVSVNTITNAYEQLLVEGYIYTVEQSGYFIERNVKLSRQGSTKRELIPVDLKETYPKNNLDQLSLSHMDTDTDLFPFKEWFKAQQVALKNNEKQLGQITHQQGSLTVRQTIAKLLNMTREIDCEPEQIVISVSTQV